MRFARWIYTVPLRVRSLFRRQRVEAELDEEIRYHVERCTEEGLAAGLSVDDARAAALRALSGIEQVKEQCRDQRGVTVVHDFGQDFRYAVRALRRSPGFTAVTVLSLVLGIGVNVAVFSVLNQALLTPPTAERPEQVVEIELGRARQVSFPDFLDLAQSGVVGSVAAYTQERQSWSIGPGAQTVSGRLVSGNFFALLGVRAARGRVFSPSEVAADPHVVVLSHRFWELRMDGDPDVIGRTMTLEGRPFTVVGILASDFRQLTGVVEAPEVYLPLSATTFTGLEDRRRPAVFPLARLPDGMSRKEAKAAVASLVARLDREHPQDEARRPEAARVVGISPAARLWRHEPKLWMMCGAVFVLSGLVLLIACANVSNVLLARGAARGREIATRLAIGASRGRLVRQLLAETVAIALLASTLSILLNVFATAQLNRHLLRSTDTVPFDLTPDARLLAFCLGLAVLATLVTGLWPAWHATAPSLAPALRNEATATGRRPSRVRSVLVVGQVATSVVLLAVAALFLRSLIVTSRTSLGFEVENVVAASVELPRERYAGRETSFFDQALARVRALPGVRQASTTALLPLGFATAQGRVRLTPAPPETAAHAHLNVVGPDYFRVLGIPVLSGREFVDDDREGAPLVVVVNHAFVRRQSISSTVVGREVTIAQGRDVSPATIVGVVGDAKYLWPGEEIRPQVFFCALQGPRVRRVKTVVARTAAAADAAALKQAIAALEPLADVQVTTLRAHVSRAYWPSRLAAGVLGTLGALGVVLATVGLSGVLSFVVAARRREIGVRMALGATRARVLGTFLLAGLRPVSVGAAIGLAASLVAPRPLAAFLAAGVTPTDPISLSAVVLLVAGAGAAGSMLPAWRASRLDPMRTLRCE